MRIQDQVRKMKGIIQEKPAPELGPTRTGSVLLPEEIGTTEKATSFKTDQ